jgi:hypothetical protein
VPTVVVANAALTCIGWFLLPGQARNWLFNLHGPLAFPVVLESWMLADVPATNVLGEDAPGAMNVLTDRLALRQFLNAKRVALWLFVAPVCALLALVIGFNRHTYISALSTAGLLLLFPFGVLGISALFGIALPYRQRPLRWRWENRGDRRTSLRWAILIVAPYWVVPAIAGTLVAPSLFVARRSLGGETRHLTEGEFALGAALACLLTAVAYYIAHQIAARMVKRRAVALKVFLTDPDQG